MNTVVDGQSAEAVLDSPAVDPVLEASPPADAVINGVNGQAVKLVLDGALSDAAVADTVAADAVAADGDAGDGDVADAVAADTVIADADAAAEPAADSAGTNLAADGEPSDAVARPTNVTETLAASALVPDVRPAASAWDADRVVTEIYHGEYKSLVRLAVLLVHDVPTAEEVVQDAFEAMHTAWRRLREEEKALSYLRQAVVNKSRSVLRHRTVVDKNAPKPAPDEPSAEQGALALIERSAVVAALRTLPDRQREAIVLRYYADLSEADIAATMGISRGAVKSHTARAMAALKSILEQET